MRPSYQHCRYTMAWYDELNHVDVIRFNYYLHTAVTYLGSLQLHALKAMYIGGIHHENGVFQ